MARKTKQQAQETRQHILDVALRMFSQQGVSSTSLAEIAKAAGVTRGAIYWHFKNKSDLFSEIWELAKPKEGANKRGNSSRLTQSFHFFMFEPIF
ncbi:TetR family transcriptional regulator, partial [Citrobacter freundii]|uniref:TetR family transcriptional regulator n=1 Tax=Citrobacter freundii TaxID=546 RepID=UPI001FFE00E1